MMERPDPLVPSEVDLRDFTYMPLDVVRLRDCDLAATASGEEFRAAVLLWCASWHQTPAASLPNDDAILSALAGFGRVVKEWFKVKDGALRNWVECSDGRLYHPTVAEKANEAWQAKKRQRDRTEAARNARLSARHKSATTDDATKSVTGSVTETVTSSKGREGKGEGRENRDNLPAQLPVAAPGNELDRVQAACCAALGEKAPVDLVIGPMVEAFRQFGEKRVLDTLRSEARRPRQKPVKSWKLWAVIVGEASASAPRPPSAQAPPDEPAGFFVDRQRAQIREWVDAGKRSAVWNESFFGPPPDEPSCRIPHEMLAEFGLSRVPYPRDDEAAA